MPLTPGTRLGPYEIVAPLGAGGLGDVFRAKDARLGRDVAIKVVHGEAAHDPERIRRFEREARAASALSHPNVCAVFDLGTYEGAPFVVMELLEGETLRSRLDSGPIPARKAIEWAAQVARGLAAAHEKGIVHRDLKPENLFVTMDGRVKVLDFGLAKLTQPEALAGEGVATVSLLSAESGAILGTIGYMAPEQVRGERADARTDLFALGAVLHELVTGRRTFRGATFVETGHAILNDEPEPLDTRGRNFPPGLEPIVRRCLEKNRGERFQCAQDLAFDLERLVAGAPGVAVRSAPSSRRFLALWTLGAVAAAFLGWGLGRMTPRGTAVPANPRPVVVLMDSPLPGRVYDPRTAASGGTNADDITDALRGLPVVIEKENTSAAWHREDQVLRANPDLIISHLSALLDERVAQGQEAVQEHIFTNASDRLLLFFGYVAGINARTRFLVYSRTAFTDPQVAAQWVKDWETRLPAMRGRLYTFSVPGDRQATFRTPDTASALRERVAAIVGSADGAP
jgi:hypothetical protein